MLYGSIYILYSRIANGRSANFQKFSKVQNVLSFQPGGSRINLGRRATFIDHRPRNNFSKKNPASDIEKHPGVVLNPPP